MNTPKTGIINDELNIPEDKPVRNVFQINLIQNRGVNQMAITTATSATIPTASLDELKALLEGAITERDNADNKIEEIRKAIATKLQEVQQLNETATNVGTIISNSKRGGTNQIQTTVQNIVNDTSTIDLSSIWTGFVKYILPAAIMFFILWILMSMLKSNAPKESGYNFTAPAAVVCIADTVTTQLPKIIS